MADMSGKFTPCECDMLSGGGSRQQDERRGGVWSRHAHTFLHGPGPWSSAPGPGILDSFNIIGWAASQLCRVPDGPRELGPSGVD